ncbi:MAG: response regulator transcription factor [Chloroflexi bacterium]|nr:response regulator transcription factor [Chloroflexota bacterium]
MRVLIVEDHAIVRQGVRLLLDGQPDLDVVGEADEGGKALALIAQKSPDVVLMDLAMPGVNGLEATGEIKRSWPHVQVIALTVHDNDEYFFQMITAGAAGYVLKGADPSELLEAIRTVHQGQVFLHPTLTTKLVRDYLRRVRLGEVSDGEVLSERERQVLRLIGEGQTTQEIAEALCITASTVQTHRAHIMEKLNLHRRSELMKYAVRRGLIGPEDSRAR